MLLSDIAKKKICQGIICGHPMQSGIYNSGGITFLFAGYWTETLSVLAEKENGKWEIVDLMKIMDDNIEASLHESIMEELFEEEKNIIFMMEANLTKR